MKKSNEEKQLINNIVESELFLIKDSLLPDEFMRPSTFDDINRRLNKMYKEGSKSKDDEIVELKSKLTNAKEALEFYKKEWVDVYENDIPSEDKIKNEKLGCHCCAEFFGARAFKAVAEIGDI